MGRQQGCSNAQGRIIDEKNNSRNNDVKEKQNDRKLRAIGRNTKK